VKPSDLARMMASGQGGTTEFEGTPAPFSSFPLIDVAEPAVEPVAGELFEAPVEEDGPGALRRAAGAVGRAGMGVLEFGAGAVEPLQIYQDTLFALVVGARDADRSILDYFADLGEKPMAYIPFGERPNRPVDGRMVAESIGITDPDTAKWVGLALDVGADPLVFGSHLTAIGRIGALARLPGAARVMRLGQNIDDALSLIPVTRGGVTRGLSTLLPQAARDAPLFAQDGAQQVVDVPLLPRERPAHLLRSHPRPPRDPWLRRCFPAASRWSSDPRRPVPASGLRPAP